MTDQQLAHKLARVCIDAQNEHRTQLTGFGAYTTPRIPDAAFERLAAGLAPVLRELVAEAVNERETTP